MPSWGRPAGYLFNIAFLRRVFAPKFVLHDIKQVWLQLLNYS